MRIFQTNKRTTLHLLGTLMLTMTGLELGCPSTPPPTSCPAGQVRGADNTCMVVSSCDKEHAHLSASGTCECDSGYKAEGTSCTAVTPPPPDMATTPPDMTPSQPDMTPAGVVDLSVDDFSLSTQSSGANFGVCLNGSTNFIDIKNVGTKDAPAYQIAVGLFSVGENKVVGSCRISITGTKAGQDSRYTSAGCCPIPVSAIKTGSHKIIVIADVASVTGDTNVSNDIAFSSAFNVVGTRPLKAPGAEDAESEFIGEFSSSQLASQSVTVTPQPGPR